MRKLTERERDLLAVWKAKGISNKECARRLERDKSTIGRELKRNSFSGTYVAIHAHSRAKARQYEKVHAKEALKNNFVYAYVTQHLRDGWSPDQIAGRLKHDYPNEQDFRITAETIYRWIYQKEQIKNGLYEYLRRKQKKRKKRKGRKVHRSHVPDRVSIHNRPEVIDKRLQFGNWEGDTIEGKGHCDGIHTEVERMSRKIMGRKVDAITREEVVEAQKGMFGKLPIAARGSTTLDNGRENHLHFELKEIGMKTYFADPYSSWQRGTNEHGNWHIRYYYPKGTDFAKVSEEELQDVIEEINNRPRKILSYQTANEVFDELLEQHQT